MFGQLIAALKSGDQLDIAFAEFLQMVDASEWMFHEANDVLRGKKREQRRSTARIRKSTDSFGRYEPAS